MAEINGLPVYKIKVNTSLNNNEGIDFISFVDYPAIQSNFVKFSKQPQKYHFDQDKQMVYGAILIPDMPIYRFSKEMGEYYVVFEQETIIELVRKFQTQKKTVNLNYQHLDNSQVKDAVVQEIWLTGKVDKSQTFGFDFPVNTAVVGVYVGDKEFWNKEVKSGNVQGFSIEGWLDLALAKIKQNNMEKFVEANVEGGVLKVEGETWTVNANAVFTPTDGAEVPADGEYKLDNGTVVKCVAGKVTEVVEAEEITQDVAEAIQRAMAPVVAAMKKDFNDQIEALKLEFKNKKPNDGKTDPPKTTLTAVDKVRLMLNPTKK